MNAPARATSPPSSQQPTMSGVVWTRAATTAGFLKIPTPMMPPITIMAASKSPKRRARPWAEVFAVLSCPLTFTLLLSIDIMSDGGRLLIFCARPRPGSAFDLRIDLATNQYRHAGQAKPEHKHDQRAERAVGHAV